MPESSDEDALVLLRARDARGFDLAYARGQRIFGFLVRLSRPRAVAEDLLAQVALRQRLSRARARLAGALDGASGVVAESRRKR